MGARRSPPTSPWRADPGWCRLAQVHPLAPLDDADSERLLGQLEVPQVFERDDNGGYKPRNAMLN